MLQINLQTTASDIISQIPVQVRARGEGQQGEDFENSKQECYDRCKNACE